eukprot:73188-Prymnesium_polylepis.1
MSSGLPALGWETAMWRAAARRRVVGWGWRRSVTRWSRNAARANDAGGRPWRAPAAQGGEGGSRG